MRKTFIPLLIAGLAVVAGCEPDREYPVPEVTDGWVPIYASEKDAHTVSAINPQVPVNAGKIYVKDKLLFQLEDGKGIHVYETSNPAAPARMSFIAVAGAHEMSINDNFLYTNNLNDLVSIDIQNVADPKLVSRVKDAFHILDQNVPPEPGYFECVDAAKGVVVGWERRVLKRPQCIRN
jgi:hypothetical protein